MQFQSILELLDELLEDKIKLDIPASNHDKMKVLPEQDRFNIRIILDLNIDILTNTSQADIKLSNRQRY